MEAAEDGHALADLLQREDAGVETVVEIGGQIGDFVGQIDELGLKRGPKVKKVLSQLRVLRGEVVAGVLDDAFAHAQRQIQAAKARVALLEPGDNAQGVQIVVEAEQIAAQAAVERLFARVAKGRVADVVNQGQRFGKLRVEPQGHGQRARDLHDLKGMGQAAAEVVGWGSAGHARKDLGLASEAAKGAGVQNAGRIPGKGRAIGMRRLGMDAPGQLAIRSPADGNPWRQLGWRPGFRLPHRSAFPGSLLVISQSDGKAIGECRLRAVYHHRMEWTGYMLTRSGDRQCPLRGSTIQPIFDGARAGKKSRVGPEDPLGLKTGRQA